MTLDYSNIGQTLITEFLNRIKQDMIDYMDGKLYAGEFAFDTEFTKFADRNATGASKASIQVTNVSNTSGQIIGANHIEYVFRGRGPGKMPPLNKIIDWCAARGLPRSLAWSIGKKISESGTTLHQALKRAGKISVLDNIITKELIDEFTKNIAKIYVEKIDSDIKSILAA